MEEENGEESEYNRFAAGELSRLISEEHARRSSLESKGWAATGASVGMGLFAYSEIRDHGSSPWANLAFVLGLLGVSLSAIGAARSSWIQGASGVNHDNLWGLETLELMPQQRYERYVEHLADVREKIQEEVARRSLGSRGAQMMGVAAIVFFVVALILRDPRL